MSTTRVAAEPPGGAAGQARGRQLTADDVGAWVEQLVSADGAVLGDDDKVDVISALESLKGAAAAAQARHSVALDESQRAQAAQRPEKASVAVGHQVALARRESPFRGSRHLGLAKALVHEMPHTHAALSRGEVSEWGATLVVQATACLSREDRARADAQLASRFGRISERRLAAAARSVAYQLDPVAFVDRGRRAARDRRVSVRPAPDVMAIVSALLPAAQGVACYRALDEHAKALRAQGDERTLDQIKADALVERVTGQERAGDVPIEVGLVMTDGSLFGGEEVPARLEGYGPVPAQYARDLLTPPDAHPGSEGAELATTARVWLRRLYTDPVAGSLADRDPRRRLFGGALRRYLIARDQVCRTPYCDAPIRHVDHARPYRAGGPTTAGNGQGLCRACNQAKESPGWHHRTQAGSTRAVGRRRPRHASAEGWFGALLGLPDAVVTSMDTGQHSTVITPTGHRHESRPPPVLDHLGSTGPPRCGRVDVHRLRRIYRVDGELGA